MNAGQSLCQLIALGRGTKPRPIRDLKIPRAGSSDVQAWGATADRAPALTGLI